MEKIKPIFHFISWTAALRYSTRILTIIKSAVLARFFLSPTAFGLFGVASLLLILLELLTETGINIFLIQQKSKVEDYLSSAWIVSIVRGLLIGSILFICAPTVASFFNQEDLVLFIRLISIVPVLRGFINPAIVSLQKDLLFKKEFLLRIGLFIFDFFVTLYAAFITHDASSFIWGQVLSALLEVFLSFLLMKSRPSFIFEKQKVKEVIAGGKWVTASGFITFLSQEVDDFAVGRYAGINSLGLYRMAFTFGTLPVSEITEVINRVMFPVYTRLVNEKAKLFSLYMRMTGIVVVLTILFSICIFFFADVFIPYILGNEWLAVIPLVKILVFYGCVRSITNSVTPLFWACKKQKTVAFLSIIRLLGLCIFILPFIVKYNVTGAAYAALLSAIIEVPFVVFYLHHLYLSYESENI